MTVVEVAGLGYHIDEITRPAESVALIRKVQHPSSDIPITSR